MFPLTHVLVAGTLLKSTGPQVVLGAIFPDLGNAIGLNRDITHEMGAGFFGFCRCAHPDWLDFARAIITHGSQPAGLDFYADQSYGGQDRGYCFQRAVPLVDRVVRACGLPPAMGLWKAHNFIEMAYELIAVERDPDLPGLVQLTLDDRRVMETSAQVLGQYFNMDTSQIGRTFQQMPDFFCLSRVTSLHLAEKYALQLKERHGIKGADRDAIAELIDEARTMIEGEFSCFIETSSAMIARLLTRFWS